MDKIDSITKQLTTQLRQKSDEPLPNKNDKSATVESERFSPLSENHLGRLWQRMAEIYGHKWVSSYGAAPSDTWAKGLAGITPRQLADGLNACLKRGEDWPPSLPEFRALCETKQKYMTAAHRPFPPALPKPRMGKDQAAPHLDAIRKALGR